MFASKYLLRLKPRCTILSAVRTRNHATVTLIPGDGIGPEISNSVVRIFEAAKVGINWEKVSVTPVHVDGRTMIPEDAVESIKRNKVGLKGPLETPVGKGHKSLNLLLRQTFKLYANLRPCKSLQGVLNARSKVDTILVRENTEGEYCGIEHDLTPDIKVSVKLITRDACKRVSQFAFQHARLVKRPSVTILHMSQIMRVTDSLFIQACSETASEFTDIKLRLEDLDTACKRIVSNPELYDNTVLLMPNLYGDIMSDLGAGLIGGLGLTPSANIGEDASIFESVHGTAPDLAGKDLANPTALLLSSVLMLRHMKLYEHADRIENAVLTVIRKGKTVTRDLGGSCKNSEFTNAIIQHL